MKQQHLLFAVVLFFLLLFAGSSAQAVTRYADGQLVGNCTSNNYSIANRACNGSDGNAYGGTMGLENAAEASSPGDTVLIRAFNGQYIGGGDHAGNQSINLVGGTSLSNRITYEGYSGDGCAGLPTTIGGANSNCPVIGRRFADVNNGMFWLILKNVIVDGQNAGNPGDGSLGWMNNGGRGVRFENVEVKNFSGTAMSHFPDTEFINLHVHHNGIRSTQAGTVAVDCSDGSGLGGNCHGIYSPGPNMVYDGGSYHHNPGNANGIDILCYPGPCSNNTFKNLTVQAFFCHGGSGNLIYNVIALEDFGPQCGGSVYNVTTLASVLSSGGNTLRNIIALGGISGRTGSGAIVDPTDINITVSNSVCPTGTWPSSPSHCTAGTASAVFADSANNDFRLCTGAGIPHVNCPGASPAIGIGFNLSATFTVDIVGTTRTVPWDVGAYKAGASAGGAQCNDTLDNDKDGLTDFPADPGCASLNDNDETNATPPPAPTAALIVQISCDNAVTDSSGKGNHGTLENGATYTTLGKYNQACTFDGINDAVTIADSATLDELTHAFTLSAWVNPSSITGDRAVIVRNPSSKAFLFSSISGYCGANMPMGGFTQGTIVTACHGTQLPINTWTHLTMTFDSQAQNPQGTLYINGIPTTTLSSSAILDTTTGTLQIGNSGFGEAFVGSIDEIRIYNYKRTTAQVVSDMNTPINALSPDTVVIKLNVSSIKSTGTTWKYGTPP